MSEFFTSLTPTDVAVLNKAMSAAMPRECRALRVLEIGVFYGSTARGIRDLCKRNSVLLFYVGVDDGSHPNFRHSPPMDWPWPTNVVKGESWNVFQNVPDDFDLVIIDGNHSGNAVILDTALYRNKVRKGGLIMFHDTGPHCQQLMPEQNAPDDPWWRNSVNEALALIEWPWKGWTLMWDEWDEKVPYGGFRVFRRDL